MDKMQIFPKWAQYASVESIVKKQIFAQYPYIFPQQFG